MRITTTIALASFTSLLLAVGDGLAQGDTQGVATLPDVDVESPSVPGDQMQPSGQTEAIPGSGWDTEAVPGNEWEPSEGPDAGREEVPGSDWEPSGGNEAVPGNEWQPSQGPDAGTEEVPGSQW